MNYGVYESESMNGSARSSGYSLQEVIIAVVCVAVVNVFAVTLKGTWVSRDFLVPGVRTGYQKLISRKVRFLK